MSRRVHDPSRRLPDLFGWIPGVPRLGRQPTPSSHGLRASRPFRITLGRQSVTWGRIRVSRVRGPRGRPCFATRSMTTDVASSPPSDPSGRAVNRFPLRCLSNPKPEMPCHFKQPTTKISGRSNTSPSPASTTAVPRDGERAALHAGRADRHESRRPVGRDGPDGHGCGYRLHERGDGPHRVCARPSSTPIGRVRFRKRGIRVLTLRPPFAVRSPRAPARPPALPGPRPRRGHPRVRSSARPPGRPRAWAPPLPCAQGGA